MYRIFLFACALHCLLLYLFNPALIRQCQWICIWFDCLRMCNIPISLSIWDVIITVKQIHNPDSHTQPINAREIKTSWQKNNVGLHWVQRGFFVVVCSTILNLLKIGEKHAAIMSLCDGERDEVKDVVNWKCLLWVSISIYLLILLFLFWDIWLWG